MPDRKGPKDVTPAGDANALSPVGRPEPGPVSGDLSGLSPGEGVPDTDATEGAGRDAPPPENGGG